jgi:hypothetical protein
LTEHSSEQDAEEMMRKLGATRFDAFLSEGGGAHSRHRKEFGSSLA